MHPAVENNPDRLAKKPGRWSLRLTLILMMVANAALVFATAAALITGIATASWHIERAAAAQYRLELLLRLSGRVSDYGIAVLESARTSNGGSRKHDIAKMQVDSVFSDFNTRLSDQIHLLENDDEQADTATKGLAVARMQAQFNGLHRQMKAISQNPADAGNGDLAQSIMNAFGVQFAPLLAQALEDERQDIQKERKAMAALSRHANLYATALIIITILAAIATYVLAGRSILRRIAETIEGADEIAAGNLGRRLTPRGTDELTDLMIRFNEMAENLGKREAMLLRAQETLQATIDARTRALKESNARLEDIDSQRKRFFSDVSHELRTPLTVILGESDLALKSVEKLDPDIAASLATIRERGESLRRRVDDLLRVARSESGNLELAFRAVDLCDVVTEAMEETHRLAEKYNVRQQVLLPDTVLPVHGDPDWLRQALSGLLVNAVRYGDSDASLSVSVAAVGSDHAQITITNYGRGIPKAERDHLFTRFYRGATARMENEKRGDRGFGIGLSLIRWVVEEHGGRIAIETNDGIDPTSHAPSHTGTSVIIDLPLKQVERPETAETGHLSWKK